MKINDVVYYLNTSTASDAQVEFLRDPDGITHTRNGITPQILFLYPNDWYPTQRSLFFASFNGPKYLREQSTDLVYQYWYCLGSIDAQVA